MDAIPRALESSRSQLSHAQGFKSKSCTVALEYSIKMSRFWKFLQKLSPKIEILTPKNTNLGSECLKIWKMPHISAAKIPHFSNLRKYRWQNSHKYRFLREKHQNAHFRTLLASWTCKILAEAFSDLEGIFGFTKEILLST